MNDRETLNTLLTGIEEAFASLESEARYYDLPAVRDYVCEHLKIPEGRFRRGCE